MMYTSNLKSFKSAFTVDVEDGVSIAMRDAFGKIVPQTNRVEKNTFKILDLLDNNGVKGTFFILGQVAESFPELVYEIGLRGHEIGVHGYDHWQFYKISPQKAFDEISRAKHLIEDVSGQKVYGHRAPSFSIMPETKWGLDIVAEAGFTYDSSIMPCKMKGYGWPGFPKEIVKIETTNCNSLIEIPMTTDSFFGKDFPVCGGGYLRLFPEFVTRYSFNRISAIRPVNIYIHPYELDIEKYPDYYFEELNKCSFIKRLKMKSYWMNRGTVYNKIENLLKSNQFEPLINIVNDNKNDIKLIKV